MFRTNFISRKRDYCSKCKASRENSVSKDLLEVCSECGHHFAMSAPDRIASLTDSGTFRELDRDLVSVDPLHFVDVEPYQQRLRRTRKETGLREAVVTGFCRIGARRVVLVVFDFRFLGGTTGSAVGEKITRAIEMATKPKRVTGLPPLSMDELGKKIGCDSIRRLSVPRKTP